VLSVTQPGSPQSSSRDNAETNASASKYELTTKYINIQDDPTEDLLQHLKEACDWIEASLAPKQTEDKINPIGVLVQSTQGISRSGAIVVAHCKWYFPGSPTPLLKFS